VTVRLRDDVEAVLRSWDAHERNRGAAPVIDHDSHPNGSHIEPAASRLEIFERLGHLQQSPSTQAHPYVAQRVSADLAYLRALMGNDQPST
jgi:hypothetical protein